MRFAGIKRAYSFAERNAIPRQWRDFAFHIGAVPGQIGETAYGLALDAGREDGFDYLTAVEVAADARPPATFDSFAIEPARCAVFHHAGNVAWLADTLDLIHRDWAPRFAGQGLQGVWLIERYGARFDPETGEGGVDILLPLKS
ncbi:MAG: GyrI-like domain-containing protein [Amphiplicatus sp.]